MIEKTTRTPTHRIDDQTHRNEVKNARQTSTSEFSGFRRRHDSLLILQGTHTARTYDSSAHLFSARTASSSAGRKSFLMLNVLRICSGVLPREYTNKDTRREKEKQNDQPLRGKEEKKEERRETERAGGSERERERERRERGEGVCVC